MYVCVYLDRINTNYMCVYVHIDACVYVDACALHTCMYVCMHACIYRCVYVYRGRGSVWYQTNGRCEGKQTRKARTVGRMGVWGERRNKEGGEGVWTFTSTTYRT
jgi:hypothetical protein